MSIEALSGKVVCSLVFHNAEARLPKEDKPLLCKVIDADMQGLVVLTYIGKQWVTDATCAQVYGSEFLCPVHGDYQPVEWAYLYQADADQDDG